MNYDITAIKDGITIPQLLRKMGHDCDDRKKMIKAPFRDEKTASCSIFAEGKRFKDFGSDEHGDVVDMYRAITGKQVADAIEDVAKLAGIAPGDFDMDGSPLSKIPPPRRTMIMSELIPVEYLRAQRVNLKHFLMENPTGSAAQSLRWIPEEHRLMILRKGWLGADHNGNLTYLMRRGVKVRTTPGSSRGDRWRMGKACDNLFVSFDDNDIHNQKRSKLLVTEGESDAIAAMIKFGDEYRIAGCLSASILPPMEMLYPMVRGVDKIVIAFDGDEAGRRGGRKLASFLEEKVGSGIKIEVTKTPEGEDLKSLFLKEINNQVES